MRVIALLASCLTLSAAPHPLADKVMPGAALTLEFPDLTPDRRGRTASCEVRIPAGYATDRKFPLVAWLAGGEGGTAPSSGFLPLGDFILVGLPYPKGAANPAYPPMVGDFAKIWAYHRTMLEDVHRLLPNVERRSSILAGFSNGGHAIDGMLRARYEGPRPSDHFGIFIAADGGGNSYTSIGTMQPLGGRYAYVCWGEKSPNRPNGAAFSKALAAKGAKVTASEMKGVGHAFPESEQAKVKDWLARVALPGCADGK